jgi:hypothetical protein
MLVAADPEMTEAYHRLRAELLEGRSTAGTVAPRFESHGQSFLLPLYKVDRADPWGETTLLGVRNTGAEPTTVEITYYDRAAVSVRHEVVPLGPAQVKAINLRDLPELQPEGDGFAWGFAVVHTEGSISTDSLQVDPTHDFATGDRLAKLDDDVSCSLWDTRFLNGGSFSGGTELTLLLGDPRAVGQRRAGAGAIFEVFDEQGASWGVVYFFSNQAVSRLHIAEILSALPAAPDFGSLEVLFMPETGGGLLYADFRAEGRYAASLRGTCIEGP